MVNTLFVESKNCKACAIEINETISKKLKPIIEHRDMCAKCVGCQRLHSAKELIIEKNK